MNLPALFRALLVGACMWAVIIWAIRWAITAVMS